MGPPERVTTDLPRLSVCVLGQAAEGEAVSELTDALLLRDLRQLLDELASRLGDGDIEYGLAGIDILVQARRRELRRERLAIKL